MFYKIESLLFLKRLKNKEISLKNTNVGQEFNIELKAELTLIYN